MATPGVESEIEDQQQDLSYLSVNQEFKDQSTSNQRPSNIVVFLKWVITLISAGIFLASLVVSKLTLFGLVKGLKAGKEATVINYQAYCMCLVLLLAPNIISLIRSLWNITGWSHLPWPNKKAVGLVSLKKNGFYCFNNLIKVDEAVFNFTVTCLHVQNDIVI